ncbi:flagellar hook-length control protein FliK [Nitrosospira lacus]|nr:flagellar hook-length control protein FliK [Nitrosospira lacus]
MFAFNALNALTRISPGLALARRQSGDVQLLAGLEPGQRLRATVQSNLANGEFMVALDARNSGSAGSGQTLHMRLPAGVRSGDVLNLIFVSREPQPTFTLTSDASPAGVFSRLSEAGRLIDSLLRHPVFPSGSATLSSAASFQFPLLATPPTNGADLARSLESALGRSGLFYESHLAQWVAGTRSLAELLLEPQARLSGQPIRFFANAESNAGVTVPNNTTDATKALASEVLDPVHPSAMGLVRQQLEAFEMRHFSWQGVAWPGQTITWEAFEEGPQEQKEEREGLDQSAATWQTCLRLTLPNLGPVTASLRLNARGTGEMSGAEVRLTAAEPMTAAALRAGAVPLAKGLEAVGIKLTSMGVDLDEEEA